MTTMNEQTEIALYLRAAADTPFGTGAFEARHDALRAEAQATDPRLSCTGDAETCQVPFCDRHFDNHFDR